MGRILKAYRAFNTWLAVLVTNAVGSMSCAWLFVLIAFWGLPAALHPGGIGLLYWISGDFLQLTLLSVIIVGQNIQAARHALLHDKVDRLHEMISDSADDSSPAQP